MPQGEITYTNGWGLYAHPVFLRRLDALTAEVERLMEADEGSAIHHPSYKLLMCVTSAIEVVVPGNPGHKNFRQGGTLGRALTHWHRVKRTLPQRYRLFFQFRSSAPRSIIYAWLNDEHTLRNDGGKSDCYAVFKAMVERGDVPNSFEQLLVAAEPVPATGA